MKTITATITIRCKSEADLQRWMIVQLQANNRAWVEAYKQLRQRCRKNNKTNPVLPSLSESTKIVMVVQKDGRACPHFVCHRCHQPITSTNATLAWNPDRPTETIIFCGKDRCDIQVDLDPDVYYYT